ncbi:MAG: CD225/dispanin family protein [Tannerella sp.]|jgi:uncharacterized integral membrane protein|nr:CD225/dispanin family protein [Tannerella sp.]
MEEKDYYYLSGETKVGPLSLEALKSAPVTASTLVWNNTLPNWVAANTLPELQGLFAVETAPPPTAQAAPAYSQRSPLGGANVPPPMPENYLVWAILTTMFCCWPVGIFAIINSTKVSSAYIAGDYEGAQKASENAKNLAIWTAIAGGIVGVIVIIIYAIVIAVGISSGALDY